MDADTAKIARPRTHQPVWDFTTVSEAFVECQRLLREASEHASDFVTEHEARERVAEIHRRVYAVDRVLAIIGATRTATVLGDVHRPIASARFEAETITASRWAEIRAGLQRAETALRSARGLYDDVVSS